MASRCWKRWETGYSNLPERQFSEQSSSGASEGCFAAIANKDDRQRGVERVGQMQRSRFSRSQRMTAVFQACRPISSAGAVLLCCLVCAQMHLTADALPTQHVSTGFQRLQSPTSWCNVEVDGARRGTQGVLMAAGEQGEGDRVETGTADAGLSVVGGGGCVKRLRGGADAAMLRNKRQRLRRMEESEEESLEGMSGAVGAGANGDAQRMEVSGSDEKGKEKEKEKEKGLVPSIAREKSAEERERDGEQRSAGRGRSRGGGAGESVLVQQVRQLAHLTLEAKRNRTEDAELSADAKALLEWQRERLETEKEEVVAKCKQRMRELLDWRNKSSERPSSNDNSESAMGDPPDHSRGGFACVLLDRDYQFAYRLEPMRNQLDACAWLAFHIVLEMFGVRAAKSVETDRPGAVMAPDRAMASQYPHRSWNGTGIVRLYQEPTMAAFSKHVMRHRNRLLRKSTGMFGGFVAAGEEGERKQSRLLTPRLWFWHRIDMPILPENENGTITEHDQTRRVRGRELADVLCGLEGGGERGAPHGVRSVRLLCTVFDLGSTDLASVCRGSWQAGAPVEVPEKVVRDIMRALRCMHACGIAHGDVKMANILHIDDGYWLGDLPALTRATTKMLTNDPVCSTLAYGKRMLANDLWGLGLITISLLAGWGPFKKTCDIFKRILTPQASGPLWVIFAAGFLHCLSHLVPEDPALAESARCVRALLHSPTGRKMIKNLSKENRELCRAEGELIARHVNRHSGAPKIWAQLAYCMDISNVARNALAMPLVRGDE